jgi:hypothetical protein
MLLTALSIVLIKATDSAVSVAIRGGSGTGGNEQGQLCFQPVRGGVAGGRGRNHTLGDQMHKPTFHQTPLARGIAFALGLSALTPGFAQTAEEQPAELEEIVVTGIRASLTASMDLKRNSFGVVDAITAEDMGVFPDTNLAESLQRITGVSIDRERGEGARRLPADRTARASAARSTSATWRRKALPASRSSRAAARTSRPAASARPSTSIRRVRWTRPAFGRRHRPAACTTIRAPS